MINNKIALPTIILMILLSLCSLLSCKQDEQAPLLPGGQQNFGVTAVKLAPSNIPFIVNYLGRTEASRMIEVRTRVEGFLIKQNFTEGNQVKKGDLLFHLDPKSLEAILDESKAQLAMAETQMENARRNVTRLEPLAAQHAVSQKDLDDAVSAAAMAEAVVQGAQAKVKTAGLNLGYTVISSPITGLTGRVLKQEGSFVSPGPEGLLTTVSQIDPLYVDFSVSEKELTNYDREVADKRIIPPRGGSFDVELMLSDGTVYPIKGKLNFSNPSFNQETGTLNMRAIIANPRLNLLPGLYVRVILKGAIRPDAIIVPQRAVLQGQKGKFLYVIDKNERAELRHVEVGDWYGENWIINSGLKGNETVIVDGAAKIQAGMPVSVTGFLEKDKNVKPSAGKNVATGK